MASKIRSLNIGNGGYPFTSLYHMISVYMQSRFQIRDSRFVIQDGGFNVRLFVIKLQNMAIINEKQPTWRRLLRNR